MWQATHCGPLICLLDDLALPLVVGGLEHAALMVSHSLALALPLSIANGTYLRIRTRRSLFMLVIFTSFSNSVYLRTYGLAVYGLYCTEHLKHVVCTQTAIIRLIYLVNRTFPARILHVCQEYSCNHSYNAQKIFLHVT